MTKAYIALAEPPGEDGGGEFIIFGFGADGAAPFVRTLRIISQHEAKIVKPRETNNIFKHAAGALADGLHSLRHDRRGPFQAGEVRGCLGCHEARPKTPAADWAIADALSQWWDAGPQTERERLDTYVECGLSIIAPLIADFAMTDAVTVLRGCRLRAGQFTLHELGDHIASLPGSGKLVLEYVDPEPVFGEIEPPASRLTRQPDRDSVLPTHAPGTSPESNEGLRQVAAVLCNLRWNRQRSQAGPWEWALMTPVELRPSPSMAPLWELA